MRLRNAALAYAARGWPVFPCKPGEKVPATRNGVKDATCDRDQIVRWWETEWNIGLATGEPSGLWVVDIDGDEGLDNFIDLGAGIPGTLTAYTPSGGFHLVFADPGGLGNTASKLCPKVDTRGTGGYIVAAPSIHPNGGRYRWGAKQEPEPVPGWLIRLVRQAPKDTPLPAITRTDLADGYVRAAVTAEAEAVASAVEGCRNDTLNRAGWNLGTLVGAQLLDRDTARQHLETAAASCGLKPSEINNTLDRALDDGARHPRQVAT
jgi:hypothetical protein